MKVLVTGGTGFIGSRLSRRCLDLGHRVRIYGQENTPAEKRNRVDLEGKGVEVVLGSMTEADKVIAAVDSVDIVFHLAAAQHEANVPDSVFWDVNVKGTQTILDAAARKGVRRFVHGSTIGVYGASLGGIMDEKSPLKPDNIYGVTKLKGEQLVLASREKQPVVVIRISETYGPGDQRLLKLFKTIQKSTFFMIGSGDNIHHLIYIEDLVEGMLAAAKKDEALGEVFVLSGKEPLTTNEMVRTIARVLGTRIPSLHAPLFPFLLVAVGMEALLKPMGIQPPLHRRRMDFFKKSYLFSMEKSRKKLGFIPKYSFGEGAAKTAAWYRKKNYL